MDLQISPSPHLTGEVEIPPNKSHSFRALLMAALADGTSRIHGPAVSNDWLRGVEALEMFGAEVTPKADRYWEVRGMAGKLATPEDVIGCGNSGILLRFFTALAGCCEGYSVLSGDESLRHIRPCGPLLDAINALGGWAVSTKGDGRAPLVVRGRLKGGRAEIDGKDSQPVSAMLIAASLADAPTELTVHNAGEKPWVGVTLHWLDRCGVDYANEEFRRYHVRGRGRWDGFTTEIPLDWSAALYPIVAAVLTERSEVRLRGMDYSDAQGDKAVVEILRRMGADIEIDGGTVVARSGRLSGREIDCNDFVDQFPLLAVVGTQASGETALVNAEICRHKECDRITAMRDMLAAMGADVEERPDGLVVRQSRLHGARIESRHDHRMVMTAAVAGLIATGTTTITDIECVKKTFPEFVKQMQRVGADLETD